MSALQLEFFRNEEDCEMAMIRKMCHETKLSADKCRRKQFADIGELRKVVLEMNDRLNIIERNICHGRSNK